MGDQCHSALVWDLQAEFVRFGKLTEQEMSSCSRPKTEKEEELLHTNKHKHVFRFYSSVHASKTTHNLPSARDINRWVRWPKISGEAHM